MSLLASKPAIHYLMGLVSTALGAWLTEVTGSWLPLSVGAAASVMATVPLVRAIRAQHTRRHERR